MYYFALNYFDFILLCFIYGIIINMALKETILFICLTNTKVAVVLGTSYV